MKKLLLIDGSNIMFRAYYATAYSGKLMKNSKGQYTNAVFAFVNMINSLLNEEFTHMLVAFDKSGKTFRHADYPDYKGGRSPMPDEFRSQIQYIKGSLDVLGVKQCELELIEADDIIGTMTKQYINDFDEIEIVSNDKDLLQLVNPKVRMRAAKKGGISFDYNEQSIMETLHVTPSQVTDLKGLMGDSSDNLPGVPGVGEKTAVKLLTSYQTLDGVYEHIDEVKGKLKERLVENEDSARLCKKIATIKVDVDLPFSLNDTEYLGEKEEELMTFFQELELHSLIKKYQKKTKTVKKSDLVVEIVNDVYKLEDILQPNSFITLETFETYYHQTQKLGFGLVNELGNFFVPYDYIYQSIQFQMFLTDASIPKYVYDYKMMTVCLLQDNLELAGVEFDLLLAAYVLNPNNTKDDFKVIVSHFDFEDIKYIEQVYGKGARRKIPEEIDYARYAANKAFAIKELKETLIEQLNENNQYDLFYKIELPLAFVLANMEHSGITVDQERLDALDKDMKSRLEVLKNELHELAGEPFNVNSPKQLGVILFEKLNLPFKKKTKTGYSTSVDILEKLKTYHPIIPKIMQQRMLSKLHSTYIIGLKNAVLEDGKIHTIYRQAFTSTGRLSSVEPNLQNIPVRYEEGREIRKVFIPEKDHQLLAADYSQVELRVLAHMAEEPSMTVAFNNNEDIHTKTAQLLFDVDKVSSLQRRQAKAVNFGIIYGQTAWGLSEGTDLNPKDAKHFIERYYERFPKIKSFMDEVVEHAIETGYAKTMYERRRYLPGLSSSIYMQREAGKRNAMNAPIQGSAADIIKIAMIDLYKEMKKQKKKSKMLLQIHDELVFDIHPDEVDIMQK